MSIIATVRNETATVENHPSSPKNTQNLQQSSNVNDNTSQNNNQQSQKMNGLSLSELCCLFCCPPCPARIAAKLAFLPPEPTYSIISWIEDGNQKLSLKFSERADWQYTQRELERFEVHYAQSSRGNRIACLYAKATPNPKYTILFSHGNAVDLGQMSSFYLGLGSRINCNIFSYDYSGFGASSGKPSEKNLYADINAAWLTLRAKYGISPDKIILYGQSIGTVPTVDLASRNDVGAVILHSPLMSGMRVAFPNTRRTWFFDAFPNIDKVPKINAPVLVIHGTEDDVIDFSHGLAIYERCPRTLNHYGLKVQATMTSNYIVNI
ncbi:Alpha/beta hydrolase domain-containing protein 17C [Sarcoptes scabiei]|uniref:Alpha/beta hydrolase domain-containing protein 17C n=1 Tax=Sarcoptes scabiei TaxID=52283 RepID=A0A834RBE9_SARSC|nr:Alpha/beta hydrolase domain-containing protein 17C [Sarcoptes scabiei]